MAAKTQHIVIATMIVARTGSTERYFDRGNVLPEDVSAEERKRLVGRGLVKLYKVEETDELDKTPPADTKGTPPQESAK